MVHTSTGMEAARDRWSDADILVRMHDVSMMDGNLYSVVGKVHILGWYVQHASKIAQNQTLAPADSVVTTPLNRDVRDAGIYSSHATTTLLVSQIRGKRVYSTHHSQ